MSSEVITGVNHFSPQHACKITHLHVGLHLIMNLCENLKSKIFSNLCCLESIDVYSEVRVVESSEVSVQIIKTLFNSIIDSVWRKLRLNKDSETCVVVQLSRNE